MRQDHRRKIQIREELNITPCKELDLEYLLGRKLLEINQKEKNADIRNKRILITGAAGSIGSEIVRHVIQYQPSCIILIDQAESHLYELEREISSASSSIVVALYLANIVNVKRIESIFKKHRPQVVFHAAAYKHVPMLEHNLTEAIRSNSLGTKILADLSAANNVEKFVMISTDKAVNPTSVMGCSKRIAEIYIQSFTQYIEKYQSKNTAFVITRLGNVFGSSGSVVPVFKKQLQKGGPITVTHPETTRYFMTITEAVQLILEAGRIGKGGEIFIFNMGDPIKILDLAKRMIFLYRLEADRDIKIIYTGLRKGEKLCEELISAQEKITHTEHEQIKIARVKEYSYHEVNTLVNSFYNLLESNDELKMISLMEQLVPEYKSSFSKCQNRDDDKTVKELRNESVIE